MLVGSLLENYMLQGAGVSGYLQYVNLSKLFNFSAFMTFWIMLVADFPITLSKFHAIASQTL